MRECPKRNAGRVMTPPSDRVQNKPRYNAKANCTAIAVDPVAGGHVTQEVTLKTDNAQVKNDIAVVNRCVTESIQSNDLLYVDHKVESSELSRSNECLFDPAFCLFGFNIRFCTIMANWTRLPGGQRLRGRRQQKSYNAHTLVTSLPRKVTHITQSYTNNANQKHNNCYQSDTSYSLN
jgi:hypothetical protein